MDFVFYLSDYFDNIVQGFRPHADKHYDSNMMYRSHFSRDCPESSYPELERQYYKRSLQQPFTESEEEIAEDIERRYLLKNVRTFSHYATKVKGDSMSII